MLKFPPKLKEKKHLWRRLNNKSIDVCRKFIDSIYKMQEEKELSVDDVANHFIEMIEYFKEHHIDSKFDYEFNDIKDKEFNVISRMNFQLIHVFEEKMWKDLVLSDIIKAIRLVEIYNNETYELYSCERESVLKKVKEYLDGKR